jgi:hypothetical protein
MNHTCVQIQRKKYLFTGTFPNAGQILTAYGHTYGDCAKGIVIEVKKAGRIQVSDVSADKA